MHVRIHPHNGRVYRGDDQHYTGPSITLKEYVQGKNPSPPAPLSREAWVAMARDFLRRVGYRQPQPPQEGNGIYRDVPPAPSTFARMLELKRTRGW